MCTVKMVCQNACAKNAKIAKFQYYKHASRSGRPVEIDSDKIKALVDANRRYTTRDVTEILNVSKSSVENHLKALGYVSKLDVWIPHLNLIKRIIICDSPLKREENDLCLKRMITGDKKI